VNTKQRSVFDAVSCRDCSSSSTSVQSIPQRPGTLLYLHRASGFLWTVSTSGLVWSGLAFRAAPTSLCRCDHSAVAHCEKGDHEQECAEHHHHLARVGASSRAQCQ
jgi:hypothetical protein